MARRRKQRDITTLSLPEPDRVLLEPLSPLPDLTDEVFSAPSLIGAQDLRQFDPEGELSSPSTVVGTVSNISRPGDIGWEVRKLRDQYDRVREFMEYPERLARQAKSSLPGYAAIRGNFERFNAPRHVAECVRRKIRRSVMFSMPARKRRKGAGARRRRDSWSDIHC